MIPLKKISLLLAGFIAFSFFYGCNTDTIDALEKRISELENSTPDTIFITSTDTLYISNLDTLYLFDTVYLVSDSIFIGDLLISGQEQLNEFGSYGFKKIIGSLTSSTLATFSGYPGYDVSDLAPLSSLEEVNGWLEIRTLGSDLTGLNNLTKVTGGLQIIGTGLSFTSLAGLESLKEVGTLSILTDFTQDEPLGLTNLDELSSLSSVSGDFSLDPVGPSFESVDGLAGVKFTGEYFGIAGGESNSPINLTSLAAINGLDAVKNIDIYNLPALTELFTLSSNAQLTSLGIGNTSLTSLVGLEGIVSFDYIAIYGNANLLSLQGLENISSPLTNLFLLENPLLNNIDALVKVPSISDNIRISTNNVLADFCGIKPALTNTKASINIYGNAFNPKSADEIIGCN